MSTDEASDVNCQYLARALRLAFKFHRRLGSSDANQHVPVCTESYLFYQGFKKVQTRFKLVIFCILFACLTAALLRCSNHIQDMKLQKQYDSLYLVWVLPVYLALDDGSQAQVPLRPRLLP